MCTLTTVNSSQLKDQDQRLFSDKRKEKVKMYRHAGIQCCEQIWGLATKRRFFSLCCYFATQVAT